MQPEDQRVVRDLIQKLKNAAAPQDRERISIDLETAVAMACEPEMVWNAPVIIRQNNKSYRAYPIDA